MATTKNITMKQFNGTDYDTLYPKTIAEQVEGFYSKEDVLSNGTKALYGLADSAVPDDVFVNIKNMFDGRVRIATGTYRGTGTHGANNKCSLTFPFVPKLVIIYNTGTMGVVSGTKDNNAGYYAIIPNPVGNFQIVAYDGSYYKADTNIVTFSGNSVSWYVDYSYSSQGAGQLNASGTTYGYIAIGGGAY